MVSSSSLGSSRGSTSSWWKTGRRMTVKTRRCSRTATPSGWSPLLQEPSPAQKKHLDLDITRDSLDPSSPTRMVWELWGVWAQIVGVVEWHGVKFLKRTIVQIGPHGMWHLQRDEGLRALRESRALGVAVTNFLWTKEELKKKKKNSLELRKEGIMRLCWHSDFHLCLFFVCQWTSTLLSRVQIFPSYYCTRQAANWKWFCFQCP